MAKGSQYERDICKRLSLWWSHGRNEDVFWRTAGSGGRATARRKQGKRTIMQGSDITAIDPDGAPLIDLLSIELKRGYSRSTFQDAIDALPNQKNAMLLDWFQQATDSATNSGSFSWMLIHKRNQRRDIVYLPSSVVLAMRGTGALIGVNPHCRFVVGSTKLVCTTLEQFLATVSPEQIRQLAEQY